MACPKLDTPLKNAVRNGRFTLPLACRGIRSKQFCPRAEIRAKHNINLRSWRLRANPRNAFHDQAVGWSIVARIPTPAANSSTWVVTAMHGAADSPSNATAKAAAMQGNSFILSIGEESEEAEERGEKMWDSHSIIPRVFQDNFSLASSCRLLISGKGSHTLEIFPRYPQARARSAPLFLVKCGGQSDSVAVPWPKPSPIFPS